tara:strand:+ start:2114 stop:2617 length:504 start_codon:yes stop_codon:yes gene_type:complete
MTKQEFLERATVKNLQQFRGHDGQGYSAKIYFDKKPMCEVFDDAWGGELRVHNIKDGVRVEDIYKQIDVDSLWNEEWEWTTPLHLLLEDVVNKHALHKEIFKNRTKGVIFDSEDNYSIRGSKYTIKTTFKKYSNAKDFYQGIIDEIEADGLEILNADYLRTFGLKVK